MSKELEIINNQEVLGKRFEVYGSIEEPLFLAKDVADMLGNKNVTEMVGKIDEEEVTRFNLGSKKGECNFLTEDGLYEVLMLSRKPIAKQFKKEVKKILKQLRTKGVVITDKATDEAIDFEKKYGTYRIRKTFTNSKDIRKDYEQFKELSFNEWKVKRLSGKDRIKLQEIIFDSIKNRLANTITTLKGSEMLAIQELLTDIKADTLKLSNKTNGGDKANLTKQINKLKYYIPPALENYVCVDIHGMSNNYLFKYDSTLGIVKTSTYKKWINDFITLAELGCVPDLSDYEVFGDIDFSKDVVIYIKYVCLDKFDCSNFDKATIDMIFNRWLGVDDNIVKKVVSEKIGSCSRYEDGKIMYYIKNL